MSAKGADEQSLLEDASTLLMFSKTRSASGGHGDHDAQRPQSVALSRAESGNVSPRNARGSVGPASVALLPRDGIDLARSESLSPTGASARSNVNERGMVAAAALAAAATVPLPLKPGQRRRTSREQRATDTAELRAKGEWPVPDSYIVDIDSGIISCICGFNDDDGFTIQCDHCNRWQHAICYNIRDIETAPDDHLCNVCQPRKLDSKRARRKQLEKLQAQNGSKSSDLSHSYKGVYADSYDIFQDDGATSTKITDSERFNTTQKSNGRKPSNDNEEGSDQANMDETDHAQGLPNESLGKKRKNNEDVALANGMKRRKDNALYLGAKDAYSALYLPIDRCEFKDKYVRMFIDSHNNDDWVIPYGKKKFEPMQTSVKPYAELSSSKIFPGFAKLGLYMSQSCNRNDLICEYLGEVDFQKKYLMDPRNHYRIWGTTKPRVLFHAHWPIYVDARLCGNAARYMRRSCNPNVELATIRMPETSELKFVLRATRDIEDGEEIHIGWQWDLRHPILQIINSTATFDSLNDPDKYLLIHSIDTVLSACDCACGNNNKDCNLYKVKKFSQSLYRAVKSKMNNRYKLNEILNQYQGKKRRQPPILTRMAKEALDNGERAPKVIADFEERQLRSVTTAAAEVGEGSSAAKGGSLLNVPKPYKQNLIEQHRAPNDIDTSASLLDPSKYDESQVTDLEKLPIPIVLEAPTATTTYPEGGVKEPSEPSAQSPDAPGNLTDKTLASTSVSAHPKPEERSNSSSKTSLPDLMENSKGVLKKKLSFADYRKKQHK